MASMKSVNGLQFQKDSTFAKLISFSMRFMEYSFYKLRFEIQLIKELELTKFKLAKFNLFKLAIDKIIIINTNTVFLQIEVAPDYKPRLVIELFKSLKPSWKTYFSCYALINQRQYNRSIITSFRSLNNLHVI